MPETNNTTLLIGIGALAVGGYFYLEGDIEPSNLPTGSGGPRPASETNQNVSSDVSDPDTYGGGDPFEDASNTGTSPLGTTSTRPEFDSIVDEVMGGRETPTRLAGGHAL